jgi:stage V sporulation protein D (sporulation-specific penicillin-binding protein)
MAIPFRQQDQVKQRIERFFVLVAACYIVLIGRLVWLQAVQGGYFRARAESLREQKIPLRAQRGDILDRDGKPLAVTTHVGVLVCDPTLVRDPAATGTMLANLLNVLPADMIPLVSPQVMKNGKPARNVIVRDRLDPEQMRIIREAKARRKDAKLLEGLNILEKQERRYPAGSDTVHVVGLLTSSTGDRMKGGMGLEQTCDRVLQGADGYVETEVDPRRRPIPDTQQVRVDAADGRDVRTTIDSNVQHIAESELEKACREFLPDSAAAIVLDPKNGDVLAMVSYPTFDPADRGGMAKPNEPAMNRALTPYEPGSTLKILTAAAALEAGVITTSTTFHCDGSLPLGNKTIKDAEHGKGGGGHGDADIRKIIAESCNVCTAQIGMKVGLKRIEEVLRNFGMLDKTGIELTADQRGTLGEIPGGERGDLYKVARVAFGQSVMVSPLAMASVYACIANNGTLVPPRLVLAHQDASGRTLKQFAPRPGRQVIKPETAAILKSLLEEVVLTGTGKGAANVPGYRAAGKTGTAQKVVRGVRGYSGQFIASFIGFLPASDPKAVIYVMVDNPKGGKHFGSQVAAPVFKSIGQQLMWYWKVTPDDPASLSAVRTARR